MPKITIKQEGCVAEVLVDGQKVSHCTTGLRLEINSKGLPEVTLQLVPLSAGVELDDAVLRFADLGLPEVAERALLAHLLAKYPARQGRAIGWP